MVVGDMGGVKVGIIGDVEVQESTGREKVVSTMESEGEGSVLGWKGRKKNEGRGKRRMWTEEIDVPLLKEIVAREAHTASYGQGRGRFEAVASSLNSHPIFVKCGFRTDWKHARDRFKLVVQQFKKQDAASARKSGVEEEYGERKKLLLDILDDLEEREHNVALRRSNNAAKVKKLQADGEVIRNAALGRMDMIEKEEGDENKEETGGRASSGVSGNERKDRDGKGILRKKRRRKVRATSIQETCGNWCGRWKEEGKRWK